MLTVGKRQVDLSTVFLGMITAILCAGVPWAYGVGERLTAIETKLEGSAEVKQSLAKHDARLDDLELCIALIEAKGG